MATPYTQDLLDRARAYAEQPLETRRYAQGLAEVTALYSEITGQPAGTCRQCQYSNYLAVVTAYIREATRFLHPETVQDSKYIIAPGLENETFVHPSFSTAVTAENLTDAAAEFFLKNGFAHAFLLKSAVGQPAAAESTLAVTPESPLVPEADLEAEQTAHAATKALLNKEQDAHKVSKDTLKSARKAEGAAIKERDELSHKLTAANEQIAALQIQLATPATPPEAPEA